MSGLPQERRQAKGARASALDKNVPGTASRSHFLSENIDGRSRPIARAPGDAKEPCNRAGLRLPLLGREGIETPAVSGPYWAVLDGVRVTGGGAQRQS